MKFMAFRKPENSRDDKPSRGSGQRSENSGQRRKSSPKTGGSSSGFSDRRSDSKAGGPRERSAKTFGDKRGGSDKPSFGKNADKPFQKRSGDRSFSKSADKPFRKDGDFKEKPSRSFGKSSDKPFRKDGDFKDKPTRSFGRSSDRSFKKDSDFKDRPARSFDREAESEQRPTRVLRSKKTKEAADDGLIRLNRYISNAGICSRRKADELIQAGVVSVNGEVISELGYKVDPQKDVIRYNGETLKREKMVYVLLNKPKDYITTTDDPQERRTVMHLVEKATKERIYPVGRLDRNTTGLLLMTNDGDLADKLSHPRNNISKIYQVELDKNLTQGDLNKIAFGVELEDGLIKPDAISYVQGGTKREIGIQIHSGRNRIVRRIFEHLGYEVVKLDRAVYANLTKKDLPRGRWRYLEEKEVIQLKHLVK